MHVTRRRRRPLCEKNCLIVLFTIVYIRDRDDDWNRDDDQNFDDDQEFDDYICFSHCTSQFVATPGPYTWLFDKRYKGRY